MKKYIRLILITAAALLNGHILATDVTLPAGTYYFDFSEITGTVTQVEIYNGVDASNVIFNSSEPLNEGISRLSGNNFQKLDGITYLVLTLSSNQTKGDNINFLHYQVNSNTWHGWWTWSSANLTDLSSGDHKYLCKVTSSGFAWQTSGSIPSTTPILSFAAGANGSISTQTAGGVYVSSGTAVEEGTSVRLVATPETNYAFYGWRDANGSIVSSMSNYVFSMPSTSISLTAVFVLESTDPSVEACNGCFRVVGGE